MSIRFDERAKTITLFTRNTAYQMQIGGLGHLLHLYYGRRTAGDCLDYQYLPHDAGFSPQPHEARWQRGISMDVLPQEYSGANTGDFRLAALEFVTDGGVCGADLRYGGHSVHAGKYAVSGMPCARAREDEAETLSVRLEDAASGLRVELLYGVYEERDVITRAARITNGGARGVTLHRAASACLDLPFGEWELIHFHGRHLMERVPERVRAMRGIQTVSSRRGASSHHHNPFVILCDRAATEDHGECVGIMPVYSGNHRTDVEVDQMGLTRAVSGINGEQFSWRLEPGETFHTPEALLGFSADGLTGLSRIFHRFLRENVIRGVWGGRRRPVLINNWEATYFDFDAEKIVEIARRAAKLGVELMVLDDGWFGRRSDDNSSLGDWRVNGEKLPGGLNPLIERINALGMKFGIWVEPEMVSEDSDLYRAHPDWALTVPGRDPAMSRNQLALDMANPDVVEYLYGLLSELLRSHHIEYVKWDMNRNMTDVYSRALPAHRQGEAFHRCILGVYDLLGRLTSEFPEVLFEGCAGGGGRFDAGMLAYCPQIWLSDDTDAVERLTIQYGSSFGYPVSAMGAHVSASPNHQTGRGVPLGTRALVAMSGTFGYELDLNRLSEEEQEAVREQIQRFHRCYDLIQGGDYYRLNAPEDGCHLAWQFASEDGERALLKVVVTRVRPNANGIHIRLKGLDPDAVYELKEVFIEGGPGAPVEAGRRFSGSSLMYAGFTLPQLYGDYPSAQLLFARESEV